MDILADRIKQILAEQNLKQAEFARALGISANYVYLLTSGKKKVISKTLSRLIETLYGYQAGWVRGEPGTEGVARVSSLRRRTSEQICRLAPEDLEKVAAFLHTLDQRKKK